VSSTSIAATSYAKTAPSARSISKRSPTASLSSARKCVSRWPAITVTPELPGAALPSSSAGANARLRPVAPASTVSGSPAPGSRNRATGHVSAHGQGFTLRRSSRVIDQARFSSCCASSALTGSHIPAARSAAPSSSSATISARAVRRCRRRGLRSILSGSVSSTGISPRSGRRVAPSKERSS
jgi:hypothetical protein